MFTSSPDDYETERLNALHEYDILNTASEPAFEELVSLAALIYQAPIALLSLIDEQRQWFKARVGQMPAQLPREMSLCIYSVQYNQVLVITDTQLDDRFSSHPLVIDEPHIRFYASSPMVTPDGHAIGALCVMDYQPRTIEVWQVDALKLLSQQAMRQIEIRLHLLTMSEAMFNCTNIFMH
ncbi:GAF domain-containing protein [Oscillatoria sp. FACHB-1407]|uniref:GAF domain-containing protein n=1 Tax=Oscillatoria sp. FACHB-1407 TaxID=2692847 RepID=UPI0016845ED7|nr:GAF domain-containing protein [Oscillatoria sp. FACHB-1407]MBD2463077.1 GAF domain-containing protein [Oscillatoria sp. FACHB-1407]